MYMAILYKLFMIKVCGRSRVDALVKLKFLAANGKQVTATKRLNLSRAPRVCVVISLRIFVIEF